MQTMSKTELAAELRVSPARVSQWLGDGTITGSALVGTGRRARIQVDTAKRQISAKRCIVQGRSQVGAKTNLAVETPSASFVAEWQARRARTAALPGAGSGLSLEEVVTLVTGDVLHYGGSKFAAFAVGVSLLEYISDLDDTSDEAKQRVVADPEGILSATFYEQAAWQAGEANDLAAWLDKMDECDAQLLDQATPAR